MVVDDASATPVAPIVHELRDDRFRCLRRSQNGGPYSARFDGYKAMRGESLLQLARTTRRTPPASSSGSCDDDPDE